MSIIEQAKDELRRANFGKDDSRVMIGILETFFNQWDSGGAVAFVAPVLQRLIAGKPLSLLTGADDEWRDMSEYAPENVRPCFQNVRCSSLFKQRGVDGKMRVHNLDDPGKEITFPYWPEKSDIPPPVVTIG